MFLILIVKEHCNMCMQQLGSTDFVNATNNMSLFLQQAQQYNQIVFTHNQKKSITL